MRVLKPEQKIRDYALKQHVAAAGEPIFINGRKVDGLVSEITTDEAFISGGIAGGEFTCTIPQSIQPKEPEKFTPIEVRGKRLQVLSCVSRNGVTWEIVAGDPTSGQR
jgi:hypothetical protein